MYGHMFSNKNKKSAKNRLNVIRPTSQAENMIP